MFLRQGRYSGSSSMLVHDNRMVHRNSLNNPLAALRAAATNRSRVYQCFLHKEKSFLFFAQVFIYLCSAEN